MYCCIPCLASHGQTNGQHAKPSFTSVELQPTVAYLKYKRTESRMVRLIFHGGNSYSPGKVYISFNGLQDSLLIAASETGLSYYELPLPGAPVKEERQLSVRYQSNGQEYVARCIVAPTRQWSVYIMPHSHVDVGYTNIQEKVLAIHMNNIDEAIKIGQHSENYPAEARFKWNTEAIWVVENYLARADDEKKRIFWDAVKKGWINLDGAYGNINTSATSPAQLMHMFATGTRIAKEHGIEVNTMFQGDVPGSSWGLSSQADITGIKYFLSAPNASDRIGTADSWRDKPFYWSSPSGNQKLLFYQSSPYSIGYALKGTKIPNFFTIEDPKPYFTGKPSENFLNPYLFGYLAKLDQKSYPYNMTLLTWAMSDNAPIDPELPEAVKAWNEHYASPRLIITSTKQFFQDFETAYKDKIPVIEGDYTEYWTDGIASAARETAINRNASDHLQQAGAIWAIRGKQDYPVAAFDKAWTNIVMFNEHTWGAYNSVSQPEDPKAVSQWNYKQAFALNGKSQAEALLAESAKGTPVANAIDVYNTLNTIHTGLVIIPTAQSSAGDLVTNSNGKKVLSQRLTSGELAILAEQIPPYSKRRFTIQKGKAYEKGIVTVRGNSLQNGIYTIVLDTITGNIIQLQKAGNTHNLADSTGLNQYTYLPGDSLEKIQYTGKATIIVKEKGPLVASLLVSSSAPGANKLTREIRLVAGLDNIELINTIDKTAVPAKESVHFAFSFRVPAAQVRYSIPWAGINAEADQLKHANRNWYTMQRWVDVSNKDFGITWSSPDAPLFEIGKYTTVGLLGSLDDPKHWLNFTEQQPTISSWVMNNLWHTNFRRDQEGLTTFRYYLQVHNAYNADDVNRYGLENHQQLVVMPAAGPAEESLFFNITAKNVYIENINPSRDGKSVLLQLVNVQETPAAVTLTAKDKMASLNIWESTLLEENKSPLSTTFNIPAKDVMMIRVAIK
ncbi:Glycosyl hydrolases family 38 C-terminal domain-containing protein [Chitinophaga sp. CF118]|nr:Glycosyl hydrolases family 38 C-terminal domain-containing protein [Chitinophaga sp. CF118]